MTFTEERYENAVIEVFRDSLGYAYAYGPDVVRDYSAPLYMDELLPALRRMVKKLLKKYKYPPEGMEDAIATVIGQCEMWTDN